MNKILRTMFGIIPQRGCSQQLWPGPDAATFTRAERAALALTEAATRPSDRADPVPDEIWGEAARHYDEPALAGLIIAIATINIWNRLNVTTRQIAGDWANSAKARKWVERSSDAH
jgi:hypothetical protein